MNVAQIPENTGTMGRVTTGPSWPWHGIKISDSAAECYQPCLFIGENCIGCQKGKELTMTAPRGKGGWREVGEREGGGGVSVVEGDLIGVTNSQTLHRCHAVK